MQTAASPFHIDGTHTYIQLKSSRGEQSLCEHAITTRGARCCKSRTTQSNAPGQAMQPAAPAKRSIAGGRLSRDPSARIAVNSEPFTSSEVFHRSKPGWPTLVEARFGCIWICSLFTTVREAVSRVTHRADSHAARGILGVPTLLRTSASMSPTCRIFGPDMQADSCSA